MTNANTITTKYRYKAILEYDGRWFSGWQKQQNLLTVQEVVENALTQFCQQKIEVYVAGRTDAGVHAQGQVIHFDVDKQYDEFHLLSGVNYYIRDFFLAEKRLLWQNLPTTSKVLWTQFCETLTQPIVCKSCRVVDAKFHSRFSALNKIYTYRIQTARFISPLQEGLCWHLWLPLQTNLMQEAAQYLLGEHDFSSFRGIHCQAHSPIRRILQIHLQQQEQDLLITIQGNAFLHHMVRNIVGTLVLLSHKNLPPITMQQILQAKQRPLAGPTAPACGLSLTQVNYPPPWE